MHYDVTKDGIVYRLYPSFTGIMRAAMRNRFGYSADSRTSFYVFGCSVDGIEDTIADLTPSAKEMTKLRVSMVLSNAERHGRVFWRPVECQGINEKPWAYRTLCLIARQCGLEGELPPCPDGRYFTYPLRGAWWQQAFGGKECSTYW